MDGFYTYFKAINHGIKGSVLVNFPKGTRFGKQFIKF